MMFDDIFDFDGDGKADSIEQGLGLAMTYELMEVDSKPANVGYVAMPAPKPAESEDENWREKYEDNYCLSVQPFFYDTEEEFLEAVEEADETDMLGW